MDRYVSEYWFQVLNTKKTDTLPRDGKGGREMERKTTQEGKGRESTSVCVSYSVHTIEEEEL